jgi:hypothetical protein
MQIYNLAIKSNLDLVEMVKWLKNGNPKNLLLLATANTCMLKTVTALIVITIIMITFFFGE